jgi:hypothetical protein
MTNDELRLLQLVEHVRLTVSSYQYVSMVLGFDMNPGFNTTTHSLHYFVPWYGRSALIISFPRWENLSQAQHYFSSRPLNSLIPATPLSSKFLFEVNR